MSIEYNKELEKDWNRVMDKVTEIVEKRPKDLQAILFLIGIRELGQGSKVFTKEEKQDLMHIAICRLLSQQNYYEFEGFDEDGWPHWKLIKKVPFHNVMDQSLLLKSLIIEYFYKEEIIE